MSYTTINSIIADCFPSYTKLRLMEYLFNSNFEDQKIDLSKYEVKPLDVIESITEDASNTQKVFGNGDHTEKTIGKITSVNTNTSHTAVI